MTDQNTTQEDLGVAQTPSAPTQGRVRARVTAVQRDAVEVDFGYKMEGVIRKGEWSDAKISDLTEVVRPGDEVSAVVLEAEQDDRPPLLSRRAAVDDELWDQFDRYRDSEQILDVLVWAQVKGGLVTDVEGVRAFLPASLADLHPVNDLSPFVGQVIPAIITEVDVPARRIILSRKRAVELRTASERAERISEIGVGQELDGTIARLTNFGAFVDLGGIDGLVHVSEMSWDRQAKPEDIVSIGDRVKVRVLRVDPEAGKVALSMKQDAQNPWRVASQQFRTGDVVTGTVKRLSSFGAFVEVAPGVEGLVHVSQISTQRVNHPADVLKPGDVIQAKILEFRPEEERMSLSIREAARSVDKGSATAAWKEKQSADNAGVTLGDLFGDALREKFKK